MTDFNASRAATAARSWRSGGIPHQTRRKLSTEYLSWSNSAATAASFAKYSQRTFEKGLAIADDEEQRRYVLEKEKRFVRAINFGTALDGVDDD